MKRITLRLAIALLTFLIGIAAVTFWIVTRRAPTQTTEKNPDCIPIYNPNVYVGQEKTWGAVVLARFNEMPLENLPACVDESYRLIWLPTFHSPVAVRVWRSNEKYFLIVKQLDGRGGYGIGNLSIERTRSLTESEWMDFLNHRYPASFWGLPSTIDEPLPNDGAVWVVEGVRNKQYHSVKRVNPQEQFADLIKYLIKMSDLETEHDKYLP
jgi:hypothetical protein